MIIDYGSRPPLPAFGPKGAEHLKRYRQVYAASETAAEPQQDLAGYLAEYDTAGVSHVCVKARDLAGYSTLQLIFHTPVVLLLLWLLGLTLPYVPPVLG